MDEYYYSGSDFYASEDARIDAAFTDVREQPCQLAGCASVCARRFGSWWTLTGVATAGAQHVEAQQKLRRCFSQIVTLNHPNITRAVAMIQTSLMPDECIIEEYVDGLTLDKWMRTAPDEPLRRKVLEQTVDALQYCHHKGVVHGNLSPQSVMVTHQERVAKLVAFGCEGQPEDDLRALGDIIELLQLPGLKHVVEGCRDGKITSIDDVAHALRHRESGKWLPRTLVVLALLAVATEYIHPHKQVAIAESRLGDIHLPLTHQLPGALQRAVMVQQLDVVLVRNLAVELGQFANLKTAFSQCLQELIVCIGVSIEAGIAIIIQFVGALKCHLEYRLGE